MNPTDPRFHDTSPAQSLVSLPEQPAGNGSAAARAYKLQLNRITKLKSQLAELEALAQAHRLALHQTVHPLQKAYSAQLRAMVLLIDERLSGKSLTAPQRQAAVEIMCSLAASLAGEGDAEMAELHDRHSPSSLDDDEQAHIQALRAELEEALGESLDDLPPNASPEQILAAGMARLQAQRSEEEAFKEEKAERRKAKKNAKSAAAPSKAQAQLQDADTLLRTLFRQLASALHPDREQDPQERLRKTALMGQANAAYARKDLVALMALQEEAGLADPLHAPKLAEDKLASMVLLLKAQVAELERERAGRQDALAREFQVPWGMGVTPRTLQMAILEQMEELEMALEAMQHDFAQVQADAGFKRWLKQQRAASRRFTD
ncbi:MAG: hypothetical protein WEK74_13735 [Hydrogenophaga sp.]